MLFAGIAQDKELREDLLDLTLIAKRVTSFTALPAISRGEKKMIENINEKNKA